MTRIWPLHGLPPRFPTRPGEDGAFGFVRKHEIHSGIDLYCVEPQAVVAMDDGWIERVVNFTGPEVGSPWWEPTQALIVTHAWGTILYGEITPTVPWAPERGIRLRRGDVIGTVKRVRKIKEGDTRPTTMLHLELWCDRTTVLAGYSGLQAQDPVDWPLGAPCPDGLLDPTPMLRQIAGGRI